MFLPPFALIVCFFPPLPLSCVQVDPDVKDELANYKKEADALLDLVLGPVAALAADHDNLNHMGQSIQSSLDNLSSLLIGGHFNLQRHIILRIVSLAIPTNDATEGAALPGSTSNVTVDGTILRRNNAALLLYNAASELDAPGLPDLMVECGCVGTLATLTGLLEFSEPAIHTAGA